MHDIPLEVRVEVRGISQYFKETAHSLLSFILSLLLNVNTQMALVQVAQELIEKLHQLHRGLIVEFHQTEVAHERRSVQSINNLLNLSSIYNE